MGSDSSIVPQPGIEESIVAALDELGATYVLERCDETLSDTAAWCEVYGHTMTSSTSCITLASKRDPKVYSCCLVMADKRDAAVRGRGCVVVGGGVGRNA